MSLRTDNVQMPREAWNDLQEYIKLLEEDQEFLNALRVCGVDNWDGYPDAIEMVTGGMIYEHINSEGVL